MPNTNEVVLIAEATALPGKRDALKQAIDILIPKALAEPGIDVFRLHEDRDRPGHFMLYERFHNQGAIDFHFATEHFADSRRRWRTLLKAVSPRSPTSTF
jgi:quinol monooxygenase YgiN